MINGLGIVGWGVGGIEAEAGMLGQPVYFLTPDVVGVHLTGALREGVTATDLALTVTQMLRKAKVVGKFVEFFGPGAAALPVVDRATIANMAPEYGATMGFFPIDGECVNYLRATGRSEEHCRTYENYYRAQGFGAFRRKATSPIRRNWNSISARCCRAWPARNARRTGSSCRNLKESFVTTFSKPVTESGFGMKPEELGKTFLVSGNGQSGNGGGSQEPVSAQKARLQNTNPQTETEMANNHPTPDHVMARGRAMKSEIRNGSVLIAAITSCTNTSNPSVMLAAGLLAKKAVERGLAVNPVVKASLAPGSRVVSDYLTRPACNRISTSSVSISSVTVARRASAIPARSRRRSRRPSLKTTWWRRRCCPATATSRRACTRTSRRIFSCRRRSSSRSRSRGAWILTSPTSRWAPARTAGRFC